VNEPGPLVLHSTWRGMLANLSAPVILIGVATIAMVRGDGFSVGATIVLVLGLILAYVALFDLPVQCRFASDGIERRCLLRRHRIDWDSVIALRRASGSVVRGHRLEGANRLSVGMGGLAATVGRHRYMLVNHVESRDEYTELSSALASWAPTVPIAAAPPPESAPPTWLYHRRGKGT